MDQFKDMQFVYLERQKKEFFEKIDAYVNTLKSNVMNADGRNPLLEKQLVEAINFLTQPVPDKKDVAESDE